MLLDILLGGLKIVRKQFLVVGQSTDSGCHSITLSSKVVELTLRGGINSERGKETVLE
jgi:hypothetical protein